MHVRVDTIEQALRDVGMQDVGGAGYLLAYRIAADNLRLGLSVVADSVNPIAITRDEWKQVGEDANVLVQEIEVVCSNADEHRTRVETRTVSIKGLRLPTWAEVTQRDYEPWHRPHLTVDTAGVPVSQSVEQALSMLGTEL